MPAEQPNYDLIYSFARKMVFMASKHIDSKRQSNQMKTKELQYGGKKYDELRNVSKLKYDNLIFYGRRQRLVPYGTWYGFRIENLYFLEIIP